MLFFYKSSTFLQIKHFLHDSATELCNVLQFRHRRKLSSSGEFVSRAFGRTRPNNTNLLNRSNQLLKLPTSHNHPLQHPLITFMTHLSRPIILAPLSIILHLYVIHPIVDDATNVKQTETDTGDVTTTTFNLTLTLSSI